MHGTKSDTKKQDSFLNDNMRNVRVGLSPSEFLKEENENNS